MSGLHGPLDVWPKPPVAPSPVPGTAPSPYDPLDARRGVVDRVQQMQPKVYRVQGFLNVTGPGASTQEVKFPVKLVELPAFSFGWSLEEGQVLEQGNFPTINVGVAAWRTEEHPRVRYYVGAQLALSVCGRDDQKAIVHWQVEGRCLGNLASTAALSVEQTL